MSPDDTLPCPSVPPSADDREERAKVAYAAYAKSMKDSILEHNEYTWEELDDFRREAWRAAADAAYRHVIISPV